MKGIRRLVPALLCLALLWGCGGTGTKAGKPVAAEEYKERADKVVICVDYSFANSAKELLECMKTVGNAPDIEFEVLPADEIQREARMTAVRTAIMAGGGPDAFVFFNADDLINCYPANSNIPVFGEPLFPNPAKTMYAGLFLPLDDLIEKSDILDLAKMNQAVLKAGQTGDGQVILPLMYTFPVTIVESACLNDPALTCHSWQEYISCGEPLLQNNFIPCCIPAIFSQLADFESERILLSREELAQRLREASALIQNQGLSMTNGFKYHGYFSLSTLYYDSRFRIFPICNDTGGVTALITMAAAINANSAHAEAAFSYLEYFFHPRVLSGRGFNKGGGTVGTRFYTPEMGYGLWNCGITVQPLPASALHNNREASRLLEDMDKEITTARFGSEMEAALTDAFQKGSLAGRLKGKEIDKIAGQCYDLLEMMLCE